MAGLDEELSRRIQSLESQVRSLTYKPLLLPILDEDPTDELAQGGNVWMFDDGRIRVRTTDGAVEELRPYTMPSIPTRSSAPAASTNIDAWIESTTGNLKLRLANGNILTYAPTSGGSSTTTNPPPTTTTKPKPTNTAPVTRRRVYYATFAQTYNGDDSKRTDTSLLYYGRISSTHGRQRSMIGWSSSSDIYTDIDGSAIEKVELWIHNIHAYYNNGVTIRVGAHNNSLEPSSYSGIVKTDVSRVRYGKPESGYRTISTYFGRALRDRTIRGITFDQLSDSAGLYGYAYGMGSAPPRLRITYTK